MNKTITNDPVLTVGGLLEALEQQEQLRGTVVTKDGVALLIPQLVIDYPAVDSAFLLCFTDLAAKSLRVVTLKDLLSNYPDNYDLYVGVQPKSTQMPLGITEVRLVRNLVALEVGLCWFAY